MDNSYHHFLFVISFYITHPWSSLYPIYANLNSDITISRQDVPCSSTTYAMYLWLILPITVNSSKSPRQWLRVLITKANPTVQLQTLAHAYIMH